MALAVYHGLGAMHICMGYRLLKMLQQARSPPESPCTCVRPATCVRRFDQFIDTLKAAAASSQYSTFNFIADNSVDKEVGAISACISSQS